MRSTADGPWLWLNRRALALAAQQGALPALVYVALASIESQTPRERKAAFPVSLEQIAKEVGISRRAVHQHLQSLVKIGLVTAISGCSSERGNVRNRYRLEPVFDGEGSARDALGGSARHALPSARGALPPSARGALLIKNKEEEGRPPTGPTRPSSKERKLHATAGSPARLNAAPGPAAQKKDMDQSDVGGIGELEADDHWERYVRQQLSLAEDQNENDGDADLTGSSVGA